MLVRIQEDETFMRRGIALIGVVLIVVGVVLIGITFATGLSLPKSSRTVNQVYSGEWDSGEINITSTTSIAVATTATGTYGLIKATDLSTVNPTNLASLSLQPHSTVTVSSDHTLTYKNLSGQYYFVVFSSKSPTIVVEYVSHNSLGATGGKLLLPGGALILSGIIVGIVGVVLKRKPD